MSNTTTTDDTTTAFLAALEELRKGEGTLRTTAHTSSIIAQGWPGIEA